MHNTQVQEFAEIVGRRAPVIVVDPRFSVAASKAKYWLPIKPGTDTALVLAWMNVLVTEGRYGQGFRREIRPRLRQVRCRIKDNTPEWAAAETGLDPELIRATRASSRATGRASSCIPAGGPTGTATTRSGAARSRCSTCCSATTAAAAASTSRPRRDPRLPEAQAARGRARARRQPGQALPVRRRGRRPDHRVREATLTGKPYRSRGGWCTGPT